MVGGSITRNHPRNRCIQCIRYFWWMLCVGAGGSIKGLFGRLIRLPSLALRASVFAKSPICCDLYSHSGSSYFPCLRYPHGFSRTSDQPTVFGSRVGVSISRCG